MALPDTVLAFKILEGGMINDNQRQMALCMYVYILYLKSTHKKSLKETNKYRLIDAKVTPGDQM